MPGEICTLQIGQFANYIGTHFWNAQESSFCFADNSEAKIDHDVLFREGSTPKGQFTYTPRLVSVGLKGSLGGLKAEGVLYQANSENTSEPLWDGKIDICQHDSFQKNQFQEDLDQLEHQYENSAHGSGAPKIPLGKTYRLEKVVKHWSDYLRPHLHPKSILIANTYLSDDVDTVFSSFAAGTELFKKEVGEDLCERVRYIVEECDSLQGFHMLGDSIHGFSGLYAETLKYIGEEYSNKHVLSFPCASILPNYDTSQRDLHLLNTFLTYYHALEVGSVTLCPLNMWSTWNHLDIPLSFDNVDIQTPLLFHESAIMALAMDTATLSYRVKNPRMSLFDLPHFSNSRWTAIEFSAYQTGDISFGKVIFPSFKEANITSRISLFRQGSAAIPDFLSDYHNLSRNSLLQTLSQPWKLKTPFPGIIPKNSDIYPLGSFVSSVGLQDSLAVLTEFIGSGSDRIFRRHLRSSMELDEWNEILSDMRNLFCF